jgi:hypothetical protein
MKRLLLTLLLATLCAAAYGQTLKSVMIDTNGVQVNQFGSGSQTNLSLKIGATNSGFFSGISGLNVVRGGNIIWTAGPSVISFNVPFGFAGTNAATNVITARDNLGLGATWLTNTNADTFRSDIGIPLPALTNTNNADTMRALAGSTNTNEPFSGTLSWQDFNDDTVSIVVSNGIILSVSEP